MKILVSFQPNNRKAVDFEGVRMRKTIKGALEMTGVDYIVSLVDSYDIMHLISADDDSKANDAIEDGTPLIVSALYSEDDRDASYLIYKSKDGKITKKVKPKAVKFLNKASLITVPSLEAKEMLIEAGVTSEIEILLPGVNISRFDFSRSDEKEIFFRYFRENKSKKLVVAVGEYDNNMDGINAFINAAKKCPDTIFYYFGSEAIPGILQSFKISRLIKKAPSNVKFKGLVPDDVYRSAMMNACIFMLPGYKTTGVVNIFDAMAAKCQIIARDKALFEGILQNGKTAYVAEYSETLTALVVDYLNGKIKPTIDEAYILAVDNSLENFGHKLKWLYQQQINLKKSRN